MNNKSNIGAFLIGGAVGAAIALLYAPKPGNETRDELKERSRLVKDRAMETINEAQTRMETFTEESKKRLGKLRDIGQETLDEQKESLRSGLKQAKKVVAGDGEDIPSDEGLH